MPSISDAVKKLPKAELHMHIEGSIEPELMLEMARRNGVALPWNSASEARSAYRFKNLEEFLKVYYSGLTVMKTASDFRDVTADYLKRAEADNIIHAELFFSPRSHISRGIALETALEGIDEAIEQFAPRGITCKLIALLQRQYPESDAMEIIDQLVDFKDRLSGIGLAGPEVGNPPEKFIRAFDRARRHGFRLVAHAGEEGPSEYVRSSLEDLKVERIDHGVRAEDDPALIERLAETQTPLTVCPMANVRLGVFPSFAEHNIRRLLQKGLMVTANSDDPSYFGAYLGDILELCISELDMDFEEIYQLVGNGFRAAFLTDEEKKTCLERLDAARPASLDG